MTTKEQTKEVKELITTIIDTIAKHEKKYGVIDATAFKIFMIQAIMSTEELLTNAVGILDVSKMRYYDAIKEESGFRNEVMNLSKLARAGKLSNSGVGIVTNASLEEIEKSMSPEMRKAMKDILDNAKEVRITRLDEEGVKDED